MTKESRLWRVDVGGVSHRFVEACDRPEAEDRVRAAIIASLDLRAELAPRPVMVVYGPLGPLQRRKFIAALDGLTSPRAERTSKNARRKLARQVKLDLELRRWAKDEARKLPRPVDPEGIRLLLRHFEQDAIEAERRRLSKIERELAEDSDRL